MDASDLSIMKTFHSSTEVCHCKYSENMWGNLEVCAAIVSCNITNGLAPPSLISHVLSYSVPQLSRQKQITSAKSNSNVSATFLPSGVHPSLIIQRLHDIYSQFYSLLKHLWFWSSLMVSITMTESRRNLKNRYPMGTCVYSVLEDRRF